MTRMRTGFITKICRNDNLGFVKEVDTQTEYIFFLDELSREQVMETKMHSTIEFRRDEEFDQFVAIDVQVINKHYAFMGVG